MCPDLGLVQELSFVWFLLYLFFGLFFFTSSSCGDSRKESELLFMAKIEISF